MTIWTICKVKCWKPAIPFPTCLMKTQSVALAYDAACTPDFYLFDENRALIYRGQMDSSRPGNGIPVTAEDLRKAMDAALTGQAISQAQVPSVGLQY